MTQCRVHTAHHSHYPNPINFLHGEPLQLGRRDDEYPGWVWTTTPDGNQGWAPLALMSIEADGVQAQATENYTAWELTTEVGERLTLQRELNEWGWVVRASGEAGWVPLATLEKVAGG